jgi:asparagine synthase (glutamine-hydrolysing)
MCGICGIIQPDERPVDPAAIRRMNAALRHRGPDGEGYYERPGTALAMRRLAVIDLVSGDQPIANEDGSLWIVFNGEIYNFPDLRVDLEKRGHRFKTNADTECILHLYEEYGDDCIDHLRGMFAFALWDMKKRRLLAARDRLGKKPLYYAEQNGAFYFSSELSSLLTALPSNPNIDLQAIDLYLGLQYIPEPQTAYAGIRKLPAGHMLAWQDGRFEIRRYWDLDYLPKREAPEAQLVDELRHHLRQAVRMRLVSDVPLGVHLSGGIDSSIVTALMAEAASAPVKTFSVGFDEAAFSELGYARAVAERYATDHHEFILTYGDIPELLPRLLFHLGEPLADPSIIPLYHLSQLTRQHVTVALNGDGGDEAFAGYPRYWLDPWADRYLRLPRFLTRGLVPAVVDRIPDRGDRPVGASLVNGLKRLEQLTEVDRRASLLRWGSYFSPRQRSGLWKQQFRDALDFHRDESLLVSYYDTALAQSGLDRTLYMDIKTYLPGDLLVKADRMSMAASLEGRSPFLDHELMAWAARLPERYKVRGRRGKYLLRKTFRDQLPASVLQHRKQGFGIPVAAWLRGPLREWSHGIIFGQLGDWFEEDALAQLFSEHDSRRVDHGKRLWALVVLAAWLEAG